MARIRRWSEALSSWGWRIAPVPDAPPGDALLVREAMQGLLAGLAGERAQRLAAGIGACGDLGTLWHLRGAVLHAVAQSEGEARAREQIAALDAVFLRAWPEAPVSPPARLR